jgi:hypothetical protein
MAKLESEDQMSAGESLKLVQLARLAAAERMRAPWWYHVGIGLAIGAIVPAVGDTDYLWLSVIGVALVAVLVSTQRDRSGVWISGMRKAGRRVTLVTISAATTFAILIRVGWDLHERGVPNAMLWIGAGTALLATGYGFLWERALIKDAR